MRPSTVVLGAMLCVGLLGVAGCSGGNSATRPALVAAVNSPITDVPVPVGFSLRPSSWYHVIETSRQRFVNYEYRGTDGYMAVALFYREQMPNHGWTLLSHQQIDETITLNFTKNAEPCTITVTEKTWYTDINVQINLGVRPAR